MFTSNIIRKFELCSQTVVLSMQKLHVSYHTRQHYKYVFSVDGQVIFTGNDFSTYVSEGEVDAAYSLLGFLTCRPGDVEQEYFKDYTPAQLAWANSPACEELSSIVCDYQDQE